jgi:Putative beta barrel porin-7 (BBP7)
MRRTITTLLFLAVGGLAVAARAADSSGYYAAGPNSYRISDDDEGTAPASSAPQSVVAQAVGRSRSAGQEQNALYVADGTAGSGIMQTNFLDNGCGCNQNSCGCGNGCLSDCMGCCDCSCNAFRMEWLGWFTRGRNAPPLVTTSPVGTAQADAGVLGLPTTSILYGNDPIGTNLRNGLRLTYSHMFADGNTWGTARFWGIEDGSETFALSSANNPIIARPFFNAAPATNVNAASLVAFPGLATGSINVLSKNDLIGADLWLSRNWYNDGCGSIDFLGGYQFTRLDDSIVINSTSTAGPLSNFPPAGTVINVTDSFRTQNEFHGGSLGLIGRSYRGAITLEALGKIGLGNMRQAVIVNGTNTSAGVTVPTGFLALPSNIGSIEHNHFAYVPELNVNLIYNLNQSWRLIGGYTFIYWNNVVLAGNQIDTNINTTQIVGPVQGAAVPVARFQRTDFWVQGISLGGEYRW